MRAYQGVTIDWAPESDKDGLERGIGSALKGRFWLRSTQTSIIFSSDKSAHIQDLHPTTLTPQCHPTPKLVASSTRAFSINPNTAMGGKKQVLEAIAPNLPTSSGRGFYW